MLASNGTTDTISFFLHWVKAISPTVQPAVIMTDRDQAQIAALQEVYPQSRTFLCTWHVLRAMRSHFDTHQFPALWEKIKKWVKTDNLAEFYQIWEEISSDPTVPPSFLQYLTEQWMQVSHMWARVVRKNRSIFEEGDTNMLIEAYVSFCSV
jgi:MULE transposase domain